MAKLAKFTGIFLPILSIIAGLFSAGYGFKSLLASTESLACLCPSCPDNLSTQTVNNLGLIKVDIQGAVKNPGVYQLNMGQRLADLLSAAGGFHQDADQEYVAKSLNLANELQDQDKIYIPFTGESTGDNSQSEETITIAASSGSLVSINQATAAELQGLTGIGEVKSQAIIDGRPYGSLTELVDKGVISANLLAELESQLSL